MTTLISACFIGSAAARAVEATRTLGAVHSVLNRALNLATTTGTLVAVVRADVARSPLAIVTDLPPTRSLIALGITPGMSAIHEGDVLDIAGRLCVRLAAAEVWAARVELRAPMVEEAGLRANLRTGREAVLRFGRPGGLLPLVGHVNGLALGVNWLPAASDGLLREAARHIAGLAAAIRAGEAAQVAAAARGLIGLGPGATPSGDDLLIGLLATLWARTPALGGNGLDMEAMARAIAAEVPGRTTWFSEQWLCCAARGEVAEPVIAATEAALTAASREAVTAAFRRLCDLGETSGTDTAVGVLLGTYLSRNISR